MKDKNNVDVEVNDGVFTMPATDVTVAVSFRQMTEWEALQAAINAGGNVDLSRYDADGDNKITAISGEGPLEVPENTVVALDLKGYTIDRGLLNKTAV